MCLVVNWRRKWPSGKGCNFMIAVDHKLNFSDNLQCDECVCSVTCPGVTCGCSVTCPGVIIMVYFSSKYAKFKNGRFDQ